MILVTGATGILGSVIVLDLLKQGKTIRASYRSENRLQEVKKLFSYYTETPAVFFDQIIWVKVDFDDFVSLENAVAGVEEVYHCAAKVSFHPKDKLEMYETNIEGTKQLLYACQNSSVKKFCFVSSIAVLDGLNEDGMMDESSDYNHKLGHSAYAKSKHFSEMEVWRAAAEGLKVVIVNPGVIIGSGNWKSSSGTMFKTLLRLPFSFSGSTAYVDVRNVSKIAILLMENEVFDQRFILISENMKFEEMANLVRSKFGLNKVKIVPNFILKIGTALSYLLGWLFPILKMMSKVNIEAVTSNANVSNEKIKKQLNNSFIPISESIEFHLNHYKKDLKKA